jgi:hypothetical protein
MTCGVYGLVDPDTGLVRFVWGAWSIEAKYKAICERPWNAGIASGWDGHAAKRWTMELYRKGKRPNLRILQKCNENQFEAVRREWVEIHTLTGEADLNTKRKRAKNAGSRDGQPGLGA